MAEASHVIDIVFQGCKFFWCTRNNVDVSIVNHASSGIVEVVVYEPSLDVEAARIYLSLHALRSKLVQDGIDKQNDVAHTKVEIMKQATADFILDHLFIKEYSKDERKFEVELLFGDEHCYSSSNLICTKPVELRPFEMQHLTLLG